MLSCHSCNGDCTTLRRHLTITILPPIYIGVCWPVVMAAFTVRWCVRSVQLIWGNWAVKWDSQRRQFPYQDDCAVCASTISFTYFTDTADEHVFRIGSAWREGIALVPFFSHREIYGPKLLPCWRINNGEEPFKWALFTSMFLSVRDTSAVVPQFVFGRCVLISCSRKSLGDGCSQKKKTNCSFMGFGRDDPTRNIAHQKKYHLVFVIRTFWKFLMWLVLAKWRYAGTTTTRRQI